MDERVFKVSGMDCADEMNLLRAALGELPGISGVRFNLLEGTMSVTAEESAVEDRAIVAAVKGTGMEAQPAGAACPAPLSGAAGFWATHGRTLLCAASGIALCAGFLSHWFLHGSLLDALSEGGRSGSHVFPALSIGFYLAAAVTGGWFVFPKAISAIRSLRPDMNLLMTIAVVGAIGIGEWFEAGTVAFLFSLSLLLEPWSIGRARNAIKALFRPDAAHGALPPSPWTGR